MHATHLLIPLPPAPDGAVLIPPPELTRLLGLMAPAGRLDTPEDSPALPHELVVARHNGLNTEPGHTPWAAFETGTVGTPCAWITPCHWQVGAQYVALADPDTLALDPAASEALMRAAEPYFAEDGITLHPTQPGAWLATGEVFRDLCTWSLGRATGRPITPEMLQASTGHHPGLRRLQSEMQMLFYTHPTNDERQARGQLPVNAFWVSGAGALAQAHAPRPGLVVDGRLATGDPHAAWAAIAADIASHWLPRAQAGEALQLTLSGERAAQTFATQPRSVWRRLRQALRQPDTTFLSTL